MDQENLKKLLEKANEYLKNPDNIIDPYDMTFVWVSEEITEKVGRNLVGERVVSTSEDPQGIDDFRVMAAGAATVDYKVKEKEILIKTGPNEKRKALVNYVFIEFDNQPYLVTKRIKFED
ncbi:MAG: hypothetical protein ACOZAG_02610 [Patescibacteria group bacterium]